MSLSTVASLNNKIKWWLFVKSMGLCKYRHVFGKEGQGLHRHVFGVALFDVIGTVFGAWLISKWLQVHFLVVLGGLLVIGIVAHRVFCVNTTLNKVIFGVV